MALGLQALDHPQVALVLVTILVLAPALVARVCGLRNNGHKTTTLGLNRLGGVLEAAGQTNVIYILFCLLVGV